MTKYMELCKFRHSIPDAVDGAIFPNTIDPLAVEDLESTAYTVLDGVDSLVLYVTGLSVALVATLNACRDRGITVKLMHYNKDTGTYYPQKVK